MKTIHLRRTVTCLCLYMMLQAAPRTDVVLPALLPLVADTWDRVGEAAVTSLAVLLTCLPAHWRDEDLQVWLVRMARRN